MWYVKLNNMYRTMAGQWTEKKKNARKFNSEKMAKMVASRFPNAEAVQ